MIAITKVLFERVLTQAEMQQMILNSPQTAQAGQGVHVAPGVVVPAAAPQQIAVPAVQHGVIAPATTQVVAAPVVKAAAAAPQQIAAPVTAPVVVSPQVATTARRLNVSQPYQAAMNKSFNQFRKEEGRMPQVAGDRQTVVKPIDQARINQLHKQNMAAGIPAKTAPAVTKVAEQPVPVADVAKKAAVDAPAADAAKKAATEATKEASQTQKDISGTDAAGIALKKGAQATGEALGSGAKKAMEFAGENPVAGGLVAGAVGALGLRKLLQRNKSV
jgi:hypothetical protein